MDGDVSGYVCWGQGTRRFFLSLLGSFLFLLSLDPFPVSSLEDGRAMMSVKDSGSSR